MGLWNAGSTAMIFLPENAKIFCQRFDEIKKTITFAASTNAQMAELVDALVSNTNGFISMPVRSRLWAPLKNHRTLTVIKLWVFFICWGTFEGGVRIYFL